MVPLRDTVRAWGACLLSLGNNRPVEGLYPSCLRLALHFFSMLVESHPCKELEPTAGQIRGLGHLIK